MIEKVLHILLDSLNPYWVLTIVGLVVIIKYAKQISDGLKILGLSFGRSKKIIKYESKLKAIARVSYEMEVIMQLMEIDLVTLIRLTNGGNNPTVGSRLHLDAIDVKGDTQIMGRNIRERILKHYENELIDDKYIELALLASTKGEVKLIKKNMSEQILKHWLKEYKLEYLEIHHIYTDTANGVMFLLPIASQTVYKSINNKSTRAVINSSINTIRTHFEKYRSE